MQINPHVPYISEASLEELAGELLARYGREIEPIGRPPAPVEEIADFLLELNLEWLAIPDTDAEPILAFLDPTAKTIRLNERRLAYFEQYPGTYAYTLAHEIGHYQLHLLGDEGDSDQTYVCRFQPAPRDRREWQAERFASYLLLPEWLLLPAIQGVDLYRWSHLYRLRDQFQVSITALRIRLEELGQLYVTANGGLYPDRTAAVAGQRQDLRGLISQGQFYRGLGAVAQAREAYQQALAIARELDQRREEAWLCWELGRLYVGADPARAAELMSICVAYEADTGHPDAAVDAERVAQLKAGL